MVTNPTATAQKATLEKFIQGWSTWTLQSLTATWDDNCTQKNLPLSSNSEIKTRAHLEHFFPSTMAMLENFELTVHNIVHDAANGKACIYALTKADAPWGPYSNEHALFLWFDETGEKVTKIEELFDTVVMADVMPKMIAEAKRRRAAVEGGASDSSV